MLRFRAKVGATYVSLGFVGDRPPDCGARGAVKGFSEKSRGRLARYLGNCSSRYLYFGTLTYGRDFPTDGAVVKRHLDAFLKFFLRAMREGAGDQRSPSVCWFVEFQERGAPHVHLFYTNKVSWRLSAKRWSQIVGRPEIELTCSRFETIRSGRRGTISYAAKYATKIGQKAVPEGFSRVGRFWGVRGQKGSLVATIDIPVNEEGAVRPMDWWRLLESYVEQGLVRRFAWEYGRGWVYVARSGFLLPRSLLVCLLSEITAGRFPGSAMSPSWQSYMME